jgi:F-type H+-transporting ATPase subunit gamma
MASLRDIRKRIRSVRSSEKITKAMKMVAASKLRRAQDAVRRTRPYAEKLDETVSHLANRVKGQSEAPHPLLLNKPKKKRVEIIVLTSDRGLCGAFNSNTIRKAQRLYFDMKPDHDEVRISTIGRKGYDAFRRENVAIRTNYAGVIEKPDYFKAAEIADEICASYVKDELDAVFLVYNEFGSAISQKVVVKQLLPIEPHAVEGEAMTVDYIYEPSQEELLDELLPKHFAMKLFQAFLESLASEHGARMTAMENASRNAKEMISSLTLVYNRVRQAAITKELMEIIGGAEAISG